MHSKKKLIACIALMAAVLMAFTACGTPSNSTSNTSEPPAATATTAPTDAPNDSAEPTDAGTADGERTMEGNLYLEGLPLVKEQETFTLMVDDNGTPSEMLMFPILEEQTNVKVDITAFPYDIAKEKKTIALTSGDYTDVMGGWIIGEKDILQLGVNEGIFIPIDELITKYSPKMVEMLEQPGVRQTMTTPDNHIYSVPYLIGTPEVNFLPYINTKWLANVGMEMPTTTDEFKAVLMAFKEQDANGNGDAKDEIPFSGDPVNMNLGQLAGWFGGTFSNGRESALSGFTMRDGKLAFGAITEEYKNFILYMNDLYKNGLIDNELFTQNSDQWKAKGKAGQLGVSIAYGSGDFLDPLPPNAQKEDYDYMPLPVLKAPGVDTPNFERGSDGSTVFKTQVVITDKCKNPATVIRWFDNVFQFDNSVQIQGGLEGVKLKKVAEGQYQQLDISGMSEADRKKHDWGNMYTQALPKYIPVGYKDLPAEGIPVAFDEKANADDLYRPFLTQMLPSSWATDEDSARLSTLSTDIRTYMNQKQAEWITGQADITKEWDAYIKQLDTLGLQEYIALRAKTMGL